MSPPAPTSADTRIALARLCSVQHPRHLTSELVIVESPVDAADEVDDRRELEAAREDDDAVPVAPTVVVMDDQVGEARVRQLKLVVEAEDVDAAVELDRDAPGTPAGRARSACSSDPGGAHAPYNVAVMGGGRR